MHGESLWEGDMSIVQEICVRVSPCAGHVFVPQGVYRGV